MESIKKFEKFKLETSEASKILGGKYKKSDCGSVDIGGATMYYQCDLVDDEGIKATRYYDTRIVLH